MLAIARASEILMLFIYLFNLLQKDTHTLQTEKFEFNDIRKKRTIMENLKRNAMQGVKGIHNISPDDLLSL